MTNSRTPYALCRTFAVIAAIGITGCTEVADRTVDFGRWYQASPEVEIDAERVQIEHEVIFPSRSAELTADERGRLKRFLSDMKQESTKEIALEASADVQKDPLQTERLNVIAAVANQVGLGAKVIRGRQIFDNRVTVRMDRFIVLKPDCDTAPPPRITRPDYKFGCSNEANLAEMIDNPQDLHRGRDMAGGDGEALALGIQRYREGKITPLEEEETTEE